jgi:hypothetical protein
MYNEMGGRPSAPVYALKLSIVGDSAYPTGGSAGFSAAVTAAAKAATPSLNITFAPADIFGVEAIDCFGYVPAYDDTNDKLKFYWCAGSGAAMTEVTNATNLSGITFRVAVKFK